MTGDSDGDGTPQTSPGPRHAAPRRQLRSRMHLPASKVLALAAVPTALLMGAGYTPTLAMARDVTAQELAAVCATATGTPAGEATPSATGTGKAPDTPGTATSSTATSGTPAAGGTGATTRQTDSAGPADPAGSGTGSVSASASAPASATASASTDMATGGVEELPARRLVPAEGPGPSAAPSSSQTPADPAGSDHEQPRGLVGDLLGGVSGLLTGDSTAASSADPSASPALSASASTPAPPTTSKIPKPPGASPSSIGGATDPAADPAGRTVGPPSAIGADRATRSTAAASEGGESTAKDATAGESTSPGAKAAEQAESRATPASASASPSGRAGQDALCATDASRLKAAAEKGDGILPDQPWTLKSSRLALHGAVFGGVVEVQTRSQHTERVLKFTVDSIDIGDLDMSTIEANDRTLHVKGRAGSTSTMTEGPIVMYTESLTGHLSKVIGLPVPDLGPITLTPDTLPKFLYDLIGSAPIPLDLEMTGVKAVQAGQLGGTLEIPGMHLYTDDEPYDG